MFFETPGDYYPFGMLMPERIFNDTAFRFGFNNKEKDDEIEGPGNVINYGMRISDSRLGRFLSVDPLTKGYPWYTPYQFSGDKPIKSIDLDGAEDVDFRVIQVKSDGHAIVEITKSPSELNTSRSNKPYTGELHAHEQGVAQNNVAGNGTVSQPLNNVLGVGDMSAVTEGTAQPFTPSAGTPNFYLSPDATAMKQNGVTVLKNDGSGNYMPATSGNGDEHGTLFGPIILDVPQTPAPVGISDSYNVGSDRNNNFTTAANFSNTVVQEVQNAVGQTGQANNQITDINVSYPQVKQYADAIPAITAGLSATYPNAKINFTPSTTPAGENSSSSAVATGSATQPLTVTK
jgi:RHS repeat-associated protein